MKIHVIGLVAGFGGVVLLILSVLWPTQSPQEAWTEKDEAKLAEKHERWHGLAHKVFAHGGKNEEDLRDYEKAVADYDREKQRLKEAVSGRTRTSRILRWLGIIVGMAGFGLWLWRRPTDA